MEGARHLLGAGYVVSVACRGVGVLAELGQQLAAARKNEHAAFDVGDEQLVAAHFDEQGRPRSWPAVR